MRPKGCQEKCPFQSRPSPIRYCVYCPPEIFYFRESAIWPGEGWTRRRRYQGSRRDPPVARDPIDMFALRPSPETAKRKNNHMPKQEQEVWQDSLRDIREPRIPRMGTFSKTFDIPEFP